jgi:hypothetical protein
LSDLEVLEHFQQHEISTLRLLNKPQAWSQPIGREHELSQNWNRLEARVGKECLDTMMGKSLRKITRDRQREQCKKSAYMGRERFGRGFGSFRSWFRA